MNTRGSSEPTLPEVGHRSWFVGCGSCGGNGWVKNAAIVRDKTCDACANYGKDADSTYVLDSLVSTELGWCGCGNPEAVDRMMRSYLSSRSGEGWPKPDPEGITDDAAMLLAYIADELGWTEHGGSVGGAWLTPAGVEALANLTAQSDEEERVQ